MTARLPQLFAAHIVMHPRAVRDRGDSAAAAIAGVNRMYKFAALLAALVWMDVGLPAAAAPPKTRNVVLVVSDGLRWQEVFSGADPLLLNDAKAGGNWTPVAELRQKYWREDPRERRQLLLPFLWGTVARNGQLYGNQLAGSRVQVANKILISYPGYNEMLTGSADPRIDSNEFGPNPNVTVFEWLNADAEFRGKVSVFGAWGKFADIFNEPRSQLRTRAGATVVDHDDRSDRGLLLAELYRTTTRLDGSKPYDSFLQLALREHLKANRPRMLFVGYGDTDLFAHLGRYDQVLESAHNFDQFVAELWQALQSLPEYRDQTTLILTADHGRGSGPSDWKDHGAAYAGSQNIWIGVLGPDTVALGERSNVPDLTQGQVAATVAALAGKDLRKLNPNAAAPLPQAPAAAMH